jgi:Tol biopolymer transport system component
MHKFFTSLTLIIGLAALGAPAAQATAPNQNGQIVFGKEDTPDGGHIFTANPDGTHEHQLLADPADCGGWSPDGSKVSVCVIPDPQGLLRSATLSPDGTGFNLLDNPDPSLNFFCWAWSPDGSRLACEGGTDPASARDGIYTMRSSDGSGLVRLTRSPPSAGVFADACPCSYSPDRHQVSFTRSNTRGQTAIFIVNSDGTNLHQITPWGLGGVGGNWSRDGSWIVFGLRDFDYPGGQLLSRGTLYLIHPDGSGLHKIDIDTNGSQYFAKEPTWSPDGTRILFVMYLASQGMQPDLFTMNPDGSHLIQITDTPVTENFPNWGTHPVIP